MCYVHEEMVRGEMIIRILVQTAMSVRIGHILGKICGEGIDPCQFGQRFSVVGSATSRSVSSSLVVPDGEDHDL